MVDPRPERRRGYDVAVDGVLGWAAVDSRLQGRRWLADACLALVLAVLLAPVTVRTVWGSSWPTALEAAGVGVVLLAHAAVAARRSAPRTAFGMTGGLVLFLVLTPLLDPGPESVPFSAVLVPSVLVFPTVLYAVAAWCSARTSLLALALSGAGAVLVLLRLWGADYLTVAQPGLASADDPVQSWSLFLVLALVAVVLLPWSAGRYRRLRILYVAGLGERARLDERRRIAREMHDVVAHSLSVLVSQAEGGRMMAAKDPAVTVPVLDTIARAGREAMQDMSCVLQVLDRPAEDARPPEPPQPGLAELPELVTRVRRSGLPVRFEERGARGRISGAAELTVYRVIQEALTNVLKHAGPGAATEVTLTWHTGSLELTIRNDIDGRHASSGGSGRGLRGMEERLSAVGGSLQVTSRADRFSVQACVPTLPGADRP